MKMCVLSHIFICNTQYIYTISQTHKCIYVCIPVNILELYFSHIYSTPTIDSTNNLTTVILVPVPLVTPLVLIPIPVPVQSQSHTNILLNSII